MKKNRQQKKLSLLAAALLVVATGPAWAGDTTQVEERLYREHLLRELRLELRDSIRSLSLERADVVQRIVNQEAAGLGNSNAVREDTGSKPRARKSSGATL
jgi:hypothetical protein